jgi:hypothetical protein
LGLIGLQRVPLQFHIRLRCIAAVRERRSIAASLPVFVLLFCVAIAFAPSISFAQGQSGNQPIYSLSGSVVNSATGEAIPRALVRTNGMAQREAFTDAQGRFQIDSMPQGQVTVTAQKPGFFSQQEGNGGGGAWVEVGPNSSAVGLKLVPQGAIYGKVVDSAGLPIEHMPLRLTARSIREGRRRWEPRGMIETDEDGFFRFAGLMPGTYYLSAGPREGELQLMPEGEKQKSGFPHVYYPGVPDFAAASPIQLGAGQQTEANLSLGAVPVYQVAGMVSGHLPDQGVGFQVLTPAGDEISLPTNFNMETGVFTLDNVPAGNYMLRAVSQSGMQPMRAEMRITVNSNLDGLRLTLAPSVTIPIVVRTDSRASSGSGSAQASPQRPPLSVQLTPTEIATSEAFSTYDPNRGGIMVQNVDFGTYTVELRPHSPWYVQSASYGQTNVLYDDISVSPGQSYPLDVVLRDDSASISGTLKPADGLPPHATVVVVPQPISRLEPHMSRGVADSFNVSGLAPGDYLVFAFDQTEGLELSDQDVIDTYASQAAHVTLTPNQKAQVQLDLIHVGKGQ